MRLVESTETGRPIIWLAEWLWYGGQAHGRCPFISKDDAIRYAIMQACSDMDWSIFPDSKKRYPNDDRDGSNMPVLTPVFRATWETNGGGFSQVTMMEVVEKLDWLDKPFMKRVEEIFNGLHKVAA